VGDDPLGIGQVRHVGRDAAFLVRQIERDQGRRPGLSATEREEMKRLEREVKELRRANEILKSASVFFAAELDRRPTR
jgi:transposase